MTGAAELGARDYAGLSVTVMGLGLFGGGAAAARFFAARGARVTVTDLRSARELAPALEAIAGLGVRTVLGEHRAVDFEGAALVVASPAVAPASPYLEAARRAGARVTSEAELFLTHCRARVAAVTGTQGKSSTCAFLAQLLEAAGERVHLGGNIGAPLLARVGAIAPGDRVVLELSSYQLEALPAPLPRRLSGSVEVAVLTNVLADHLERHGTLAAYRAAKLRLFELCAPGGVAIAPLELAAALPGGLRLLRHGTGRGGREAEVRREAGRFVLDGEVLARPADLGVPGRFQEENVALALAAARALGIPGAVLAAALPRLVGLPHRVASLGWRAGRQVIDNGVSTTPDSTESALLSVDPGATLLCGGRAKKGLALDALAALARERGARVVAFGEAAATLAAAFARAGVAAEAHPTLAAATRRAFELTPRGAQVLFSPACSSFDAFSNFEARARAFQDLLPPEDLVVCCAPS